MGISKSKQILGLIIYKMKGSEILPIGSEEWDSLPEQVIDHRGEIINTVDWMEEIVPDTEYLFVDQEYADPLLDIEIKGAGMDEIFKGVNLSQVLYKVPHCKRDGSIGPIARIVVEMTYRCDGGWEQTDNDCDLDVAIIGYLNDELQLLEI